MIGEVFNKNHHEDILKNSSDMPISVDTQKEKRKRKRKSTTVQITGQQQRSIWMLQANTN